MLTAINTKIKAMYAKLLTDLDYKELCEKAEPPTEAAAPQNDDLILEKDLAKISPYLDKPVRGFLRNTYIPGLMGLESNEQVLFMLSRLDSPQGGKSSHESLKRVLGTETDLKNLLYVYRLKKFHKIDGDAVFSFLNPTCHRLSSYEISQLAHAKDMESFAQVAANGFYGGVFSCLSDFKRGEQKLTCAVRSRFKKEERHENLAVVCGYLYARHLELKNLAAIAEGKKNGLASEEIFASLHI